MFTYRRVYLYLCLLSILLLAGAAYLQYAKGIQPCLLCLMQRVVLCFLALASFAAVLHNHNATSRKVYNIIMLLIVIIGIVLAGRQVWLQHLPATAHAYCIPGEDYMNASWVDLIKYAFTGYSDCSEVQWRFLGWSMAHWSLVFFILFALLVGWQFRNKKY
ncbi:MAG: disulfide bond formation protein B [Gammaproteobacteria bacterium]|nr:disulfide bond formation protein B [Gammaproteobacteria bacterium]